MDTQQVKFSDPNVTADGSPRASVSLVQLRALWFNTGSLCNLSCRNCYIESSPTNDSLEYLTLTEVQVFLDEIQNQALGTQFIGLTGGEPFLNPDIIAIMAVILRRGFKLMVLTNAMGPMMKRQAGLLQLQAFYGERLTVRVSVDHYQKALFEAERGAKSWQPMLDGLCRLSEQGFNVDVAGRTCWGEDEASLRQGFDALFKHHRIPTPAFDEERLVLLPEMGAGESVPEVTSACWEKLDVDPSSLMCASSRKVLKRKGASRPDVMACPLLAYDQQFTLGDTLAKAAGSVKLNHPNCSTFCVLGKCQ
jgi:uncharacterized Fe-S cluster-containing radical SAM superfamily protein